MAQEIVGVKIQVEGNGGEAVGSLRKQLKEAQADVQALSEKFGATSEQAVAAAKKAADLKDRIGDAKALTDAFNPDRKFQAFGAALQGVAGGFAAVQGALGLVGVKSDEVEKTLLKVQSAMALSQGVNSIIEAKDAFKNLKTVAIDAFKGIKTAIGSTGIGLLLIAVGTLVAYWDDIKEAVTGVNEEQQKALQTAKAKVSESQKELDNFKLQENSLRLQGASEKEIIQLRIIKQKQALQDLKDQLEKQKLATKFQIESEQRNEKILNGILEFTTAGLQVIFSGINAIGDLIGKDWDLDASKLLANTIFDSEALKEETKKSEDELTNSIAQLESDIAGGQLAIQNIEKQTANERQRLFEQEKARQEQLKQLRADSINQLKNELKDVDDLINKREKTFESERERNLSILDKRIQGNITKSLTDRIELTNQLLLSQQDQEIAAIEAEYQKKYELIKGNEAAELALREETERQKTDIKLKYENQRLDIAKSALSNIANVVGKETAAGKAIAIASATIDTYQAANKALKADYGIFGPAAQIARFVAVAATIAAGIKNVKEIAKAKVPNASGVSASLPSGLGSMSTAPITPQSPQAQLTQLDQGTINRLGSATNRAYVVESDITNNQERIRRINRAARLN